MTFPNIHLHGQKGGSVRAFTLVETLVSILIISLVILGPLTVAINASTHARETKDIMTATYLAQEGAELLRHVQDSLYLKCVTDTDESNNLCDAVAGPNGIYESPQQTAWRLFKEHMASGVSCFGAAKCAYDFIDMTANEDQAPTKYLPTNASCSTLALSTSRTYVCSGAHGAGGTATSFSRSIFLESIPTFVAGDSSYNDDVRATVTVTFRKSSGYTRTVKMVDFLHSHP